MFCPVDGCGSELWAAKKMFGGFQEIWIPMAVAGRSTAGRFAENDARPLEWAIWNSSKVSAYVNWVMK